jgi:hypothetical protein
MLHCFLVLALEVCYFGEVGVDFADLFRIGEHLRAFEGLLQIVLGGVDLGELY